ncbi:MAG: hypothetical protein K2X82_26665 [Gemmataceae bacterium]|nr:hypothetical protein [Gemmataceae bacterium]
MRVLSLLAVVAFVAIVSLCVAQDQKPAVVAIPADTKPKDTPRKLDEKEVKALRDAAALRTLESATKEFQGKELSGKNVGKLTKLSDLTVRTPYAGNEKGLIEFTRPDWVSPHWEFTDFFFFGPPKNPKDHNMFFAVDPKKADVGTVYLVIFTLYSWDKDQVFVVDDGPLGGSFSQKVPALKEGTVRIPVTFKIQEERRSIFYVYGEKPLRWWFTACEVYKVE